MSVIYEPKGKALEYAALAFNPYRGCDNKCVYCYVRGMPPWKFKPGSWEATTPEPRKDILEKLQREAVRRQERGLGGLVHLSFTADPFPAIERELCITAQAIRILHETGHNVATLTKAGIGDPIPIVVFGRGDWFGATLTIANIGSSPGKDMWEPHAAPYLRRKALLREMRNAFSVSTWVSLEPIIYPRDTLAIIDDTCDFVDHWKVGKLNYVDQLPPELRTEVEGIDWSEAIPAIVAKLEGYGFRRNDEPGAFVAGTYYLKESVRQYVDGGTR